MQLNVTKQPETAGARPQNRRLGAAVPAIADGTDQRRIINLVGSRLLPLLKCARCCATSSKALTSASPTSAGLTGTAMHQATQTLLRELSA
jgi:hypothetical protein